MTVELPCKHTIEMGEILLDTLRVVGPLPMQCPECEKRYRLGLGRNNTISVDEIE